MIYNTIHRRRIFETFQLYARLWLNTKYTVNIALTWVCDENTCLIPTIKRVVLL
jgi:hypothetical protein